MPRNTRRCPPACPQLLQADDLLHDALLTPAWSLLRLDQTGRPHDGRHSPGVVMFEHVVFGACRGEWSLGSYFSSPCLGPRGALWSVRTARAMWMAICSWRQNDRIMHSRRLRAAPGCSTTGIDQLGHQKNRHKPGSTCCCGSCSLLLLLFCTHLSSKDSVYEPTETVFSSCTCDSRRCLL